MLDEVLKNTNFNVQRLGHIAIRVKDIERAKSFYMSLGMKLIWDDKDWCYLEVGSSKDGLALLGPEYKAAGPHFAFHFTDKTEVEDIHRHLSKKGRYVGPLHDHRDGTASFYLKDSEDNWLEMLYHPPEGIPTNQQKAMNFLE
ncbi:VOC family protein [Prochlorococcus sp. MIT 1307]|uniref:VOC family protein n=1 Tax=Prochlorococcus sp. MIT 1307 TaxID=3096219 RepID=UPI002A75CE7D|nr:VOC family protein [Prochlorococcus sp. MIT 1307]